MKNLKHTVYTEGKMDRETVSNLLKDFMRMSGSVGTMRNGKKSDVVLSYKSHKIAESHDRPRHIKDSPP